MILNSKGRSKSEYRIVVDERKHVCITVKYYFKEHEEINRFGAVSYTAWKIIFSLKSCERLRQVSYDKITNDTK